MDKINVLVVDDAAFMRRAVSEIFESDPEINVVGTAVNGKDALEKIPRLKPDVITLDIDMPVMDGLTAVRNLMIKSPVPVVILSSMFSDGAITFEALRLGVVDFIPKPSGAISEDIDRSRNHIINRVKLACAVNLPNIRRVRVQKTFEAGITILQKKSLPPRYIVLLGTTLGGPNTIIRLLSGLDPDIPASLVVVKEIAPDILVEFVKEFNKFVPWTIRVAEDGIPLEQSTCYIGSNTNALSIESDTSGNPVIKCGARVKNPLDLLFSSAAEVFEQNTIGVLLTGTGTDGAEGLAVTKAFSGVTIAQETDCCIYPNLTDNAISQGTVDIIKNEKDLCHTIEMVMGHCDQEAIHDHHL